MAATVDAGQASLILLGDRANLLIVREAFRGTRRYQDFKERLGMSDAVLASRLHDLVDLGVFRTVQYSNRPPRSEYRFTEIGLDFWATAIGIWMWERRWAIESTADFPDSLTLTVGTKPPPTSAAGHAPSRTSVSVTSRSTCRPRSGACPALRRPASTCTRKSIR